MGALAVNTFLGLNSDVANKIAGVFYSAPFFGRTKKYSLFEKLRIFLLATLMDEILLMDKTPVHKICRNKAFVRKIITSYKSFPIYSSLLS